MVKRKDGPEGSEARAPILGCPRHIFLMLMGCLYKIPLTFFCVRFGFFPNRLLDKGCKILCSRIKRAMHEELEFKADVTAHKVCSHIRLKLNLLFFRGGSLFLLQVFKQRTPCPKLKKKRYVIRNSFPTLSSDDRNAIQPRRKERSSAQYETWLAWY